MLEWNKQSGGLPYDHHLPSMRLRADSQLSPHSLPTAMHGEITDDSSLLMKSPLPLAIACLLVTTSSQSQTVITESPSAVVVTPGTSTTKTVTVSPTGRRLERSVVRQQLSIAPKAIAVPAETVTTSTTTTTAGVAVPPATRVYIPERNVVTVRTETQTRELPYVALPVLFVVDTDRLLDQESRSALEETAAAIKEVIVTEPAATFDIEGHTSTEGTDEHNMQLSAARAQRIYDELTAQYGVPAGVFTAHGYGENYAKYPEGTEDLLQQDRRVLVVRTK